MALSRIKDRRKLDRQAVGNGQARPMVLYVEDNDENWEVTRLFLGAKFQLHRARNDQEACELVRAHASEVTAVLMDIELQGSVLNGIELTRVFRGATAGAAPPFAVDAPVLTCPIFFMTAYGDRYSDAELQEAGGDEVIRKPVDFEHLSSALTHAQLVRETSVARVLDAMTRPATAAVEVSEIEAADKAYAARVSAARRRGVLAHLGCGGRDDASSPLLTVREHRDLCVCFAFLDLASAARAEPLLVTQSLRRAVLCRLVGEVFGIDPAEGFIAGLLLDSGLLARANHDLGGALAVAKMPAGMRTVREAASSEGVHTVRSAQLARTFRLNEEIALAIETHHDLEPGLRPLCRAAWLSEQLAGVFEAGDPALNYEKGRRAAVKVGVAEGKVELMLAEATHRVEALAAALEVPIELGPSWPRALETSTLVSRELHARYDELTELLSRVVQQKDVLARRLKEANARLSDEATTDALTQVANRRAFEVTLERELSYAARSKVPLSLVILDIDHFKRINDSFGHPAGDQLLRGLARELSGNKRGGDFVARYGGEEFAIVLLGATLPAAHRVAERMRSHIESHVFCLSSADAKVTVSLGVACAMSPGGGQDAAALIDRADRALYRAKGSGRNRVCVDQE